MDLRDAWTTLGFDPGAVAERIRSAGSSHEDRVGAARELASRARSVAKQVMFAHHPDRNQGDPDANARCLRVQEALKTICDATDELESSPPPEREPKVKVVVG